MKQQAETYFKSGLLWYFIAIFGCILHFPAVSNAKEAGKCHALYEGISARHAIARAELLPESAGFYRRMHGLEDELFTALKQCPRDPLLFTLMAENQISLNNIQLAHIYASKAHQQRPDLWQTNHALGSVLVMQKNTEQGLTFLAKALQIAPEKPELHFDLCRSYVASARYSEAVAMCSRLLNMKDHELHGPAYVQRSLAYQALGKTKLAGDDLSKAQAMRLPARK